MKHLCAVVVCLLLTVSAGAQQRLGDVAGSITIDEDVVIDDSGVARAPAEAAATPSSYSEELKAVRAELEEVVVGIDGLVAEVVSGGEIFDPEWQRRMLEAAESLELQASVIDAVGGFAGQDRAFELVLAATAELRAASDAMRSTVHSRSPTLRAHNQHLRLGRRHLDEAIRTAARAERAAELEQPPPLLQVSDALVAAEALCASRARSGAASGARCLADQREAIRALEQRSWVQLGLDELAFNRLRNSCLTQWPEDFAQRNACEQRKAAEIAAAAR
jgi:hypothetical protein